MSVIEPRLMGGKETLILTVEAVNAWKDRTARGRNWRAFLAFRETEHILWLNVRSVRHLQEMIGEGRETWKGEPVPLIRCRVRTPKGIQDRYEIASPEDWRDIMKDANGE